MAELIRTGSGHNAGIMKDKLGSPSTGSDDGNDQETQGAIKPEQDEPDLGDSAHYAPPENQWYHGRLDRYQAEERLWQCNKLGAYLVRESDRKPGSYVLSYLGRTGMNHFRITAVCGDFYIGGRQFVSLNDLVGYYKECSDLLKRERLVHPVAPPEPVNDKKRVVAILPYTKMPDTDELTFKKGDIFFVHNDMGNGWLWVTAHRTGEQGMIFRELVEDLDDSIDPNTVFPWFHPNCTKNEAVDLLVKDTMDKRNCKYQKIRSLANDEVPAIVVESPSYDSLPYADEQMDNPEGGDKLGTMQDRITCEDEKGTQKRRLERKNSISMPNLDDLKVFSDNLQEMANMDKSADTLSKSPSEDDDLPVISGTRNVRRKSVLSPRMLRPPSDDIENSPANSITSVNSIASLLKEKLQNLPQTIREKKTADYKTKSFVILLFIAIVVLIVTAYVLYQQKVLAGAYFDKIKFNHVNRVMRIYDQQGTDIVRATLGTSLNYDKVLPCLPADNKNDGSICLEWMHRARLYLNSYNIENNVTCYNFYWISLAEKIYPTDCFDLTFSSWYGGGQTAELAWPLENGRHLFQPFITGSVDTHEWGNVLKRYFISSKGAAIIVDDKTPLYVSIRDFPKKELCLRAQYDDFAFVNRFTNTPHLNYSVCTGTNMSDLHGYLSEHTLWDGLKKEDPDIIDYLLKEPVWEINLDNDALITEEILANFTDDITNSVLKQGHVLINEFWQKKIGDFELDTVRFPTLEKTMEVLKRRGFRVVFTIQPFISTESFNFAETVKNGLLISERFSDRRIPALTRYKTLDSAGVLDITNNKTVPWLLDKLKKVMKKYKFDAFYLDLGTAYSMPHYYQCDKPLLNPDQYKTLFTNSLQGAIPLFAVSSAIARPKSPAFVDLPQFESSWDGLQRVVPTILTYGILGFPFLIPGAVGGDTEDFKNKFLTNDTKMTLPDRELYIRWLQLAAFLPVIKYHHLPSSYGDKDISEMAKQLATIREQKVTPRLKKFARVSLNLGLPIVRPLWMIDADQQSHTMNDQFSIGDEIIVAPILELGKRERDVYLPSGVWRDGGGNMRKGNRWLHNYKVDEDEIAYFERMPDDIKY